MARAVASRYARALSDLIFDPASRLDATAVVHQLEVFEGAVSRSEDLRTVLLSPAVLPARKRALVGRLAEMMGLSRQVRNFLCVVIGHRRTAMLAEIREAFQALVDERLGVARAEVTSARELDGEQRASLGAQLVRVTGKKIECRFSVDESLIGGVTARIGSRIYDGSVRGQLETLRRKLVE